MHIVLLEPEIPMNTGNIGRTCAATGTGLHLIRPLGFDIDERAVRRAGMDYWPLVDLHVYDDFADFMEKASPARLYLATTKARRLYTEPAYGPDDWLLFGKESAGLPEELLLAHRETAIRIPMLDELRSLNLANSVAIVLYEALRQRDFPGLRREGELHRLKW